MLDLAGVNRANPNFEVTRHLVKRCDVWLESGGREPEEVMDGYMLDVERVVAGSKTLASLDAFSVLYALSSEVLPCLDWDGKVVWRDVREDRGDLREDVKALRQIGFSAVCVMDLRRLGSELGPDPAFLAALDGLDLELYVGGGLQESDVLRLGGRGVAGGLGDPLTPVIRDLLKPPSPEEEGEAGAQRVCSRVGRGVHRVVRARALDPIRKRRQRRWAAEGDCRRAHRRFPGLVRVPHDDRGVRGDLRRPLGEARGDQPGLLDPFVPSDGCDLGLLGLGLNELVARDKPQSSSWQSAAGDSPRLEESGRMTRRVRPRFRHG